MKVLVYWHDMLLPHSNYLVQAFDDSPQIKEAILLGSRSSTSEVIFNQAVNSEKVAYLKKTKLIRAKTYSSRPLLCKFSEYLKYIRAYHPDLVIVIDEALSMNVLLASLATRCASVPAKVLFYGFDNIYNAVPFHYFRAQPSGKRLLVLLKKAARYWLLDRAMMPLRRRFVYGGLTSYQECTTFVHQHRWYPPIREQWWPIDLPTFLAPRLSLEEAEQSITRSGTRTLAFVGRFVKEKGIEDLIRAMQSLPEAYTLLLIGAGERKDKLKALVTEQGLSDRVKFVSPQNQTGLVAHFERIDLLVLPSRTDYFWKEQYGRVLVEAMAANTLVLGSDSGSIPYIIGDQRLIFREGDVSDLVRKVDAIFQSSLHQHKATLTKFRAKALQADPQVFIKACLDL